MHVDDRLATVLGARAESAATQRIQFRQLVDLLGTSAAGERGDALDAGMVRLTELAKALPAEDRARAIGDSGVRLRNPRLVAELASGEPAVALATIRTARLAEDDWLDLIPALPMAARGLLRIRNDLGDRVDARLDQLGITDRALPAGDAAVDLATTAEPAPVEPPVPAETSSAPTAKDAPAEAPIDRPEATAASLSAPIEGIGAIVRRIEAFRRSREASGPPTAANDSPRLPLGEQDPAHPPVLAFSFATDSTGRIGWAEAPVGGMAVGILLPAEPSEPAAPGSLADSFRHRLPISAGVITLEGASAITGPWRVDATPDFDDSGRFTGYIGRLRRPAPPAVAPANREADRIRQILHELRTPVNAIQGFAEVIQQQLFGATPHEYRALAAGIAADAARMLAGFEELDRYARLATGALTPEAGSSDLVMAVAGVIHQLESFTAARGSGFTLDAPATDLPVPLCSQTTEQIGWRLLATLAGIARPGEILSIALEQAGGHVRLAAQLPEGLAAQADVFAASPPLAGQALSAGLFGTGFTLRLLAAEAAAAGGSLERDESRLLLVLPLASASVTETGLHADHNAVASAAG